MFDDILYSGIYSLAAISTLYFVEHSKQNERNYLRPYEGNASLFSEKNYLGNSSYGSNGIAGAGGGSNGGNAGSGGGGGGVGGNGNVIYNSNGNYWIPDRHIPKKVRFPHVSFEMCT